MPNEGMIMDRGALLLVVEQQKQQQGMEVNDVSGWNSSKVFHMTSGTCQPLARVMPLCSLSTQLAPEYTSYRAM